MANYKNKTVCVIDNGLFVEFAIVLAKDFGTVLYYSPWESGFPKSNALMIGEGLPGVTRVKEFWSMLDEIDLFFFPDVYQGALQVALEKLGKRVWGSRNAEQIELDRSGAKKLFKEQGIPVGPYKTMVGLEALRKYLKNHDKQWVKINATRGDMETFFAKNYKLIEPRLDELEHSLGAVKKTIEFVVEDNIDPAIEVGYDGYSIDGKFPKGAIVGVEKKDKAYVATTIDYDAMPETVRCINERLSNVFEATRYRGFWSSEIRVTPDNTPYLIDPCPRLGSPPGELYQVFISNWSDIIWEGADGNLVEPKFTGKWGAELLIISEWADKNWQAIEFPSKYRQNIKLRNCCVVDGKFYMAPQWTGVPEVGAVVAVGNTKKEAIDKCNEIAETVEGHYIAAENGALNDAADQLEEVLARDKKKGGD